MDKQRSSMQLHFLVGTVYYQYYFNRKGTPLSDDFIVHEYTYGEEMYLAWSYYYQFGFPHPLIVVMF